MATQYIKICEISQNQCKMEVYSNYYLHQKVEKINKRYFNIFQGPRKTNQDLKIKIIREKRTN